MLGTDFEHQQERQKNENKGKCQPRRAMSKRKQLYSCNLRS